MDDSNQNGQIIDPATYVRNALEGIFRPPTSVSDQYGGVTEFRKPIETELRGLFEQFARPEFNRQTYNPFLRNLRGNLAAAGSRRLGFAQPEINLQKELTMKPFTDQRESLIASLAPILESEYVNEAQRAMNEAFNPSSTL